MLTLMVFTAPPYDGYNSRYWRNEIKIWKYTFREYVKNKRDTTWVPLAKMITKTWRVENNQDPKGGGSGTTFPYFLMLMLMVFTASLYDAYNSRYRNTEIESQK